MLGIWLYLFLQDALEDAKYLAVCIWQLLPCSKLHILDMPALKYFCPVVAYLVLPHLYVLNLARSWKKPGVFQDYSIVQSPVIPEDHVFSPRRAVSPGTGHRGVVASPSLDEALSDRSQSGFAWSRHLRDLLPLEPVKDSLGRRHHHGLS